MAVSTNKRASSPGATLAAWVFVLGGIALFLDWSHKHAPPEAPATASEILEWCNKTIRSQMTQSQLDACVIAEGTWKAFHEPAAPVIVHGQPPHQQR